jgi:hypothetical protein
MGHNSGLHHTGAQGIRKPREAELIQPDEIVEPLQTEEVMDALEKRELSAVRKLARQHTAAAINTLRTIMRSRKSTPASRVAAAKAILEYGHGRPGMAMGASQPRGGDAIKVVIFKLSEGEKVHHASAVPATPAPEPGRDAGGPIAPAPERRRPVRGVEVLSLAE